MDGHNDRSEKTGDPANVYREDLDNKGNSYTDTPAESDERDAAKIQKTQTRKSQKMDGINPDEFDDGNLSEEIRRETLENE